MSGWLLQLLARLSRRGDLVVAILVLTAVVMMLIPLPTFLVDALITANISISVLILLVALYVTKPLDFSSLPSVILVTTLFRLSITITTTRLILLQADAGELVTAFGTFVVGGSIAVGMIIFVIITIAQFIVVAKGSERVAEVAARFTLDALPGKQMSIDADLRNGDVNQPEARRLRQQLERESQLFGAMDGAMKFVKGDVVAGIVIILVNLAGGFAVGMLQHGMSAGQAASTYSLLTVGDGLVAQIPALLVAVAAGTMVTRVTSADGDGDLSRQITSQLLRDARVLSLAAVIMLGLSVVPGFPTIIFLILAAAFGAGAYAIHRATAKQQRAADMSEVETSPALLSQPSSAVPIGQITPAKATARVIVRVGSKLSIAIADPEFSVEANRVRHEILEDLGIEMPAIGLYVDHALSVQGIRVDLEGAPISDFEIPAGRVWVEEARSDLDLLGLSYEEGLSGGLQANGVWVDAKHSETLQKAGLAFSPSLKICAKWLDHSLRAYAEHFIGIQETRRLLSALETDYGELVKEAQQIVPLVGITEVLRRLAAENVPIRNLRVILEALIEWGQREQDVIQLTEYVRISLKRQISFRVADRNGIIAAYVLQRSAEETLRDAVQATSGGAFLDLADERANALINQIAQARSETSANLRPIVLTAIDVRRHLRTLLVHNGIDLPVLSYQELAPEFSVQPLVTIVSDEPGPRDEHNLTIASGAASEKPRNDHGQWGDKKDVGNRATG